MYVHETPSHTIQTFSESLRVIKSPHLLQIHRSYFVILLFKDGGEIMCSKFWCVALNSGLHITHSLEVRKWENRENEKTYTVILVKPGASHVSFMVLCAKLRLVHT